MMIDSSHHVLVFGYGLHGQGVVAALRKHGVEVTVVDDAPSDAAIAHAASAGELIVASPDSTELAGLARRATHLLPTPGLPDRHAAFAAAAEASLSVIGEFDLAHQWDSRPILAITGTNGKTTVTTMVTAMLTASGFEAEAAGNLDTPLVTALEDETVELFVVEASSFRLGHSTTFSPTVGAWLNFAPDHLDVHASLQAYEAAKARIWRNLGTTGRAVANATDPVVQRNVPKDAMSDDFGGHGAARVTGEALELDGVELLGLAELHRSLPHDVTNALAAALIASRGGASLDGIQQALRAFRGLEHRVELVAERDGIRWYNDSKATTPHAVVAGVQGFASVVLIAGGRNKGLDLEPLLELAPRLRGVVAIGEAAGEIVSVFEGTVAVETADSMPLAVDRAAAMARPGDAVVLSPACTSYDWYSSYSKRGEDFTRIVREQVGASA